MSQRVVLLSALTLMLNGSAFAIIINEVMYHPQTEESRYEYVEIYNETVARRDLSNWVFTDGIRFTFPPNTILQPHAYLVIAADPDAIKARYSITNVLGPFTGRLANSSDHIILRDTANGIMAEVDYESTGKWPAAANGTGHSLAKFIMRGDPMASESWRASDERGGTPGVDNGYVSWSEETEIIGTGEVWRYFKGITEASDPVNAWQQIGFNDAAWESGNMGIGYADGDDATEITDMQNNYWSIFLRKKFNVADPSEIDSLILEIDHDDGTVAYLNGVEVLRESMPGGDIAYNTPANLHHARVDGGSLTVKDISSFKNLLVAGENVLSARVHNVALASSDVTFIPHLISRIVHEPGRSSSPVVINEIYAYTSNTQYVELYNTSASPVAIGNFCLSNDSDILNMYRISSPTLLAGHGFKVFTETELGFSLDPKGDVLFITNPTITKVIDARVFDHAQVDYSTGRWPDGGESWHYMNPTTATANTAVLTSSIVINEIMYNPPTGDDDHEFIELTNISTAPVDLTGWGFTRGVDFEFPQGTTLAPGAYLVIARNRDKLLALHGIDGTNVLGNYGGNLSNSSEKIRLRDAFGNIADEVEYYDGGRWSGYADGDGSSIEMIDPRQDNNNPAAWAPSDERDQVPWAFYTHTATLSPRDTFNQSEIHMRLMGQGEVLIDKISIKLGTTEYVPNGSFESGSGNWLFAGNHSLSQVITSDAYDGSRSLLIRTAGRGDTGPNHIEQQTSPNLSTGQTYTISYWAKWQWGNRTLNVSTYANGVAKTNLLPVPQATGTPGAVNSAYQANLGPLVSGVSHSPVIPSPSDTAHITATVRDADGVGQVNLRYRADSDGAYATVAMADDGAHGDGAAGDSVYGGNIPARAAGQTVAFYMEATDSQGLLHTWPTDITQPALYRVENSPLSSNFPTYRIILTASDATDLYNRPHLSNLPINSTFIYGEKDVYYNCGVRYIGSPFHRSGNGFTGYKVSFNADKKLHGSRTQVRVDGNTGMTYNDRISQDLQRWMGVPHILLEYVHLQMNNSANAGWEDTSNPASDDYINAYYRGDDDGPIHELNDWYNFPRDNDLDYAGFTYQTSQMTYLGNDKELYRDNYGLRNHYNDDNYTSMVAMLYALNNVPTATYRREVEKVINVEEWFNIMAVRTSISDWDWIGGRRGKNCYMYWPLNRGQFDLLAWDSELTFGEATMSIWSEFAPVRKFQQNGRHQHLYFNAIKKLITEFYTNTNLNPWIDHYGSLVGGNTNNTKNFITARRNYLQNQIPGSTIAITTNSGNPFSVAVPNTTLAGSAPVETSWVRVGNVEYYLDWTSATRWAVSIALAYGTNNLTLEFLDYYKRPIGTDTITITAPPAPMEGYYLRIAELHYHPADPSPAEIAAGFTMGDDFEFIELLNVSTTATLNLTGIRFINGITVDLTTASATSMLPGARALIVRSPEAFAFRYGAGLPVIGRYGGSLDNGGEPLEYVDPLNMPIQAFRFDDESGWPVAADGLGPSLEVISTSGDYNNPANWRASAANGGSPGTESIATPLSDRQKYLRITELHYNPALSSAEEITASFTDNNFFEFIELKNTNTSVTLNLAGVKITDGVLFDFTSATITTLAPEQFVLVVNSRAAFEFRYGIGFPIAGEFVDSRLANGGETICLADANNAPIHVFAYDDSLPWPTSPDGEGPALEVIDTESDYNSFQNWRATGEIGGNPGRDSLSGPALPIVRNLSASYLTSSSVVLNGVVLNTGGEIPTVRVGWGTTDGGEINTNWQNLLVVGERGNGPFSAPLDNLTPRTMYYFRAFAENTAGEAAAAETEKFRTRSWNTGPAGALLIVY